MKLCWAGKSLLLVLGMALACPAAAQVSFKVFAAPGTYCPTSSDELMGDVVLQVVSTATVPAGSGFQVNFPAPFSATATPVLSTTQPGVPVSLGVSTQTVTVSFSAPTSLTANTQFRITGLRLDATKISGVQAFVTLTAAAGSPFSFSTGSTNIGIADQNLCPVTLVLSNKSVSFRTVPGATVGQTVSLTSTNNQSFAAPNINAATNDGANWLSASAAGSGNSYVVTIVTKPPNSMAPGAYTGTVSLTVISATNPLLQVSVSMVILQPAPQISATLLAFRTAVGVDPPTQQFTVTGIGNLTLTTQVQSPAGGTWLTFTRGAVTKDPDTNQDVVTVTVAPKAAGLVSGPSPYIGYVLVAAEQSSDITGVLIQFYLDPGSKIALDQSQLSFAVAANSTAAVTQNVTIKNGGSGTLAWTALATTDRGGSWLSVNPMSGTGDVVVAVTINPTGLAGIYAGAVQFTASTATNSPQSVAVKLTVGTVPAIADRGIKNGASFSDGPAAAGAILSIFGSNLASSTQSAQNVPLPTSLGGAQVKVNGTPGPLFYVSPGQINFQLPPDVSGTTVSIVVSREGVDGLAVSVPLVSALPGLFSLTSDGKGPGAILKSDFSLVSATNPVARGGVVLIYGSGMGPVNPPVPAGQAAPSNPLSTMVLTPSVTIGGVQARVVFAGLAPGFVGLYQINVEVPGGASPGPSVPVVISVNSAASNAVTLAVQ